MKNRYFASDLAGRIASHQELSNQPERGTSGEDNKVSFKADFKAHILDKFSGTAVVYWKGILCGQDKEAFKLWKKASSYYGLSNLDVFEIPEHENKLDSAAASSINIFSYSRYI